MNTRFVLPVLIAFALPLGAAPVMADDFFGAIAFSASTGKVGGGWNYGSKKEANQEAKAQCGVDDCDPVSTFPNCGAIAVGDGYGMGYSADGTIAKSEETALENCSGFTTNCLITMSFCNGT